MLVIVLVTFLPVTIGLVEGFAATDREVVDAARLDGATSWLLLWRIRVPLALPAFFTALRIGITYAVTGAVFAEYVGATAGLGPDLVLKIEPVLGDSGEPGEPQCSPKAIRPGCGSGPRRCREMSYL